VGHHCPHTGTEWCFGRAGPVFMSRSSDLN
jgi:hypothetical protein